MSCRPAVRLRRDLDVLHRLDRRQVPHAWAHRGLQLRAGTDRPRSDGFCQEPRCALLWRLPHDRRHELQHPRRHDLSGEQHPRAMETSSMLGELGGHGWYWWHRWEPDLPQSGCSHLRSGHHWVHGGLLYHHRGRRHAFDQILYRQQETGRREIDHRRRRGMLTLSIFFVAMNANHYPEWVPLHSIRKDFGAGGFGRCRVHVNEILYSVISSPGGIVHSCIIVLVYGYGQGRGCLSKSSPSSHQHPWV